MYKLIIIDDEALVRRALKNTIRWHEHGFELVGDFANGREALEAIEQLKPDLVLSDICMPYMDGLELTEQIVKSYPYIKVIILTGYDDFEYAQRAIRLKVHDFILKPITAHDTREILDKVRLKMDEERKWREDVNLLYNQLNQSLPLLRERFLERMVVSGIGSKELEEGFAYFGLPMLAPDYLVMVFDVDGFDERLNGSPDADLELLRFAGFNILEEIVQEYMGLLFRTREERMAVVLSGSRDDDLLMYEEAFQIAEKARHSIEKYLKYTVTVGVGRVCRTLGQLPASYKSALSALDYRFLYGKNRVIGILDMEGQASVVPEAARDWDRKLASVIKTRSAQEAYALIEQITADLKTVRMPLEACYLQIQKVVVSLINTVQELGVNEYLFVLDHNILFTDIYKFKALDDIEVWLKNVVHAAITAIANKRRHRTDMQMVRAIDFIQEHYADEKLSLQDLCRHVLMSTSYFSLVFKQYTGETFIEYLTRIRVEKAKELLRHSSLKFYEIAEKVGYSDPNYFSLLFKKQTGRTPREYRDNPEGASDQ